jgi:citrate synthase
MSPPVATMTTAQVAAYLGVKPQTVYAYVSRGLLAPTRRGGPGGSLFDAAAVEALRSGLARPARRAGGGPVEVRTQLTQIHGDRLAYRGRDAVELSRTSTFEEVCALLWGAEVPPRLPAGEELTTLRQVLGALPRHTTVLDRFKHAVLLAGTTDPGRHDRRPEAVIEAGARALGHLVAALEIHLSPGDDRSRPTDDRSAGLPAVPSLAGRLAAALGSPAVTDVDAALVLLADHDMAVSTTALRVAVSGGADTCSALLAALATADSPLHVMAPSAAYGWLRSALEDPRAALGQALAGDRPPVGFGHVVYERSDPRAEELYRRLAVRCTAEVTDAVDLLRTELLDRRGWPMTVDLPLALWALVDGLPREAGSAIFAVARTAGWTAHALEELDEPGMRFRLRGIYTGVR